MDNFSEINDKLGHINGDRVLITVARLLCRHFGKDACVARFSGGEFAVLLPYCIKFDAEARTEKLRQRIEELFPLDILITISLGMASPAHHTGVNFNQLLSLADKALSAARKAGKNCIYVFTEEGPRRLIPCIV